VEWHFLITLVAPVTLTRVSWHCESTGVPNVNPDVQRLAAIDQLEALHDVERLLLLIDDTTDMDDLRAL
jgi:hypothetical protein